ncbi:MAG: hypothetical protein V4666_11805 [Bacteroidota bacterium]
MLKKAGSYMAILGIFAIVLNFLDRVPTLLMWIYMWGDTVAWTIKIGLVVVGGALFFFAKPEEAEHVAETQPVETKDEE